MLGGQGLAPAPPTTTKNVVALRVVVVNIARRAARFRLCTAVVHARLSHAREATNMPTAAARLERVCGLWVHRAVGGLGCIPCQEAAVLTTPLAVHRVRWWPLPPSISSRPPCLALPHVFRPPSASMRGHMELAREAVRVLMVQKMLQSKQVSGNQPTRQTEPSADVACILAFALLRAAPATSFPR